MCLGSPHHVRIDFVVNALISDHMRSWLALITIMSVKMSVWWSSMSRFVSYLEFQRGKRSHISRTVQTPNESIVVGFNILSDPQQRSWRSFLVHR